LFRNLGKAGVRSQFSYRRQGRQHGR